MRKKTISATPVQMSIFFLFTQITLSHSSAKSTSDE
jgi:hypothetical protein